MAKDLGKEKDFEYFMKRSESYKNYFDKEYSLMNGYSSTGQFRRPFDPFYSSYGECDWVEAIPGNILSLFLTMSRDWFAYSAQKKSLKRH